MDDIDDFGDEFPSTPTSVSGDSILPASPLTPLNGAEPYRHKCSKISFIFMTEEQKKTDWYSILNVQKNATTGTIKEAYHKQCLETHPDKLKTDCDSHFKLVVKAFDILGNSEMRRAYDSIGPIEEVTLKDKEYTDDEFFRVFARHFRKFAKWSSMTTPTLGDITSDMNEVDNFYNFWFDFKSWRDFSFKMEDVEMESEISREEKRYIHLQCEKEIAKLKRTEARSIMSLAEKARKNDPRIKRRAKERLQERNERIASRRMASLTVDNKSSNDKSIEKEKATADVAQQKQVENEKKKLNRELKRSVFQKMRDLGALEKNMSMEFKMTIMTESNLEWLFRNIADPATILSSIDECQNDKQALISKLNLEITATESALLQDRYGRPISAKPSNASCPKTSVSPVKRDWSENDLIELQKAIIMYPRGTVERWEKISHVLKNKFSEEEVLQKTKEIEKHWEVVKDSTQRNSQLDAEVRAPQSKYEEASWSSKQQKQFEDALREYRTYKESDKWAKVAAMVDQKSDLDCQERYTFLCKVCKN